MVGDTALTAIRGHRAAEVLAESHQEFVEVLPEPLGQFFPENRFGGVGRFGFHITPAVADAVHVSIDTNSRLVKAVGESQVGGLPAHPFQRYQLLQRVRNHAVEPLQQIHA